MVALCNAMGLDAWINIPAHASDDYIKQLAALWKQNLDPKLNIYFEYSNEGEPPSGPHVAAPKPPLAAAVASATYPPHSV